MFNCIVCILYEKEKLTKAEALKGLFELVQDKDADEHHLQEVYSRISEDE